MNFKFNLKFRVKLSASDSEAAGECHCQWPGPLALTVWQCKRSLRLPGLGVTASCSLRLALALQVSTGSESLQVCQ